MNAFLEHSFQILKGKTMSTLKDKVAIITGGNSGIGLAAAQSLIDAGARVAIFGRDRTTLDQSKAQLGERAIAVQGDVTNSEDLDRLYSTTVETFGKVDVLFANAGIAKFAPFNETPEAVFDQLFDINVKGVYFTVQRALPHLNTGASVIVTTSAVNVKGLPGASAYAATKAAVRSLVRTWAAELSERNIRFNAISPGPVETPIFSKTGLPQEAMDDFAKQTIASVPLKRFGGPGEIGKAVRFLASDEASFVQGAELVADGGFSAV